VPSPWERVGESVEGRPIELYRAGTGTTTTLFVGGIHGGYEWNSVLLAYRFIDAVETGEFPIPNNHQILVIPVLNPDGLALVVGTSTRFSSVGLPTTRVAAGRFNARGVDLNRNFDCRWQPTSTWRGQTVSAGTAPASEPEAATLIRVVEREQPVAVVFWHSQANAVYGAECGDGLSLRAADLVRAYAAAARYTAVPLFDAYPVSGDAEGWLARLGIPALTVELETTTDPEWDRNRAGIEALLKAVTAQGS
jgi:predicted deacylase